MADAVLFEFLHTEMVAELWARDPDPGPGAAPGDAGLQGGAGRPQVPVQRPVGGRVPKADGQPPHQSPGHFSAPGDLRPAGQQLPPPHPDGLGPAVSGGSTQVTCAPPLPPSSWPSPAASCVAPSAPWASRAWSPPPWQPCPPVSSRW
ncbi:PREDICTED: trafficking protein particle complex subunit 6A isoform X3 [Ceratotherium simum simum]|uniref:Trafficking protein particle complex subunit 6A isoform X3 n=1 Tax=Ceratotherium simum simum TaxID=73337 RepID=A0ABM1DG36_CERSS|nr:PREDICTED: trafficking protein particle complex subunit 6A isoform X3 [Ceratotherium simum simum]